MELLQQPIHDLIAPFVTVSISFIMVLLLKDFCLKFVKGLSFKFSSSLNEGDAVIIDGETAIITKIGIFTTIFNIRKTNGTFAWRYVPNERIDFLRIEKIIWNTQKQETAND